jgi:LacI family transcriptional regulator
MTLIHEIAQHFGVSPSTVTRILNSDSDYKRPSLARRAQQIRDYARKRGYRTNAAAQAMRTGRFNAIALLLRANEVFLPPPLLRGMTRELAANDRHLLISELPEEELVAQGRLPRMLRVLAADGLLIDYVSVHGDRTLELLRVHEIPAIWVNQRQGWDCVYPDDLTAARQATEELLSLGHERIAYAHVAFPGGDVHYSETDRYRGYELAMSSAGFAPLLLRREVAWGDRRGGTGDSRIEWFAEVLGARERPTAIVCYELSAAGPLAVAAAHRGIRIPEDLSVVVFHAAEVTDLGAPVKVMEVPMERVGVMAVQRVLQKIQATKRRFPPTAVSFERSHGAVAPPPKKR